MRRGNTYLWLIVIGAVVLGLGIGASFLLRSYAPEEYALESLTSSETVVFSQKRDLLVFSPAIKTSVGLIFYPGGLVDYRAYAPLLKELAENGIESFLVKMPLDLAVISPNRAMDIIKDNPEIKTWIMAGHSLGGSMAARFASKNSGTIGGLILLASYPARGDSLVNSKIRVLSIYGTEDSVLNSDAFNDTKVLLPPDTLLLELEGGNHAQFGWYGPQKGDGIATMSREKQQELTLNAILSLIQNLQE